MEEDLMDSFKSEIPFMTPEVPDSKITEYLEKILKNTAFKWYLFIPMFLLYPS